MTNPSCQHTHDDVMPTDFFAQEKWFDRMARTHDQLQCPSCGLYAVWRPKKRYQTTQDTTVREDHMSGPDSIENHLKLLAKAEEAVNAVFGDTSVSRDQTRESLGQLLDNIQTSLDAMDEDEEAEEME